MGDLRRSISLRDLEMDDPFLGELARFLASRDVGVYLVGGYLRDYLRGKVSSDVDFVVQGDPEPAAGMVAAQFRGKSFLLFPEERTFRVVVTTDARRRTLDFSPVRGFSVEADMSMRDFTVNAMAVDLERLVRQGCLHLPQDLIDKHYGWRDLAAGILRECHKESFLADPVRLVRAFRFRHLLGLEFEERTLNHLKKYASLITRVPGERVAVELLETLERAGSSRVFAEIEATGLLQYLFPELTGTVGLEQNAYHHLDVWSHTLLTMDELDRLLEEPENVYAEHAGTIAERMDEPLQDMYPRSAFLRLAALLHDAGKPMTFSRGEDGRIHFHSHQERSREVVARLGERLRLSRRAREYLVGVVGRHMDIGFSVKEGATPRVLRRLVLRLGDLLPDVVLLSTADRFATRGPLTTVEGLERYVGFCRVLLGEFLKEKETPPLVRGHDLIRELGMREGPEVGDILREVREAQLEGRVGTREEALKLAERLLHAGGGPESGKGGRSSEMGCG